MRRTTTATALPRRRVKMDLAPLFDVTESPGTAWSYSSHPGYGSYEAHKQALKGDEQRVKRRRVGRGPSSSPEDGEIR